MEEKKKILAGYVIDGKGGVDNYLINFLEAVHGEHIQVDFLSNVENAELCRKLKQYNTRVFCVARLWKPLTQYRQVKTLIQREGYDIVYLNLSTAIECITALAAKQCNVPRRIIHSHSSGNNLESKGKRTAYDVLHRICRLFLYCTANEYYACSKKAGEWMFPRKITESGNFHLIYNAVDREKFQFHPEIRRKLRNEMGLEDCLVIGHVGSFCYQKNHNFLIRIFDAIYKKNEKAVLLLVGEGERFEKIQKQVEELGLREHVQFLGWRNDVADLMQVMDVFLLPSNFEGLPTVGIEAQCTGLPCVFSSQITEETVISDRCRFISLKKAPEEWANDILNIEKKDRRQVLFNQQVEEYGLEKQKEVLKNIVYGGNS